MVFSIVIWCEEAFIIIVDTGTMGTGRTHLLRISVMWIVQRTAFHELWEERAMRPPAKHQLGQHGNGAYQLSEISIE